jgi:hypothetical protein
VAKKPKVLPSVEWLEPRVKAMRVISLLCFFGLVGLLAFTTWCSPTCMARDRG